METEKIQEMLWLYEFDGWWMKELAFRFKIPPKEVRKILDDHDVKFKINRFPKKTEDTYQDPVEGEVKQPKSYAEYLREKNFLKVN